MRIPAPVRVPTGQHGISPESISRAAFQIVEQLRAAGFDGLLVGGCVRDLLLGRRPKDYDVVTDARPEQIKQVFRRARLIGRRFRLAHVRVGRDVLEVSTYRARPAGGRSPESHSASGRLISDNVYGTREEDAARRDFTVNAMFYDCIGDEVIDYLGGMADLRERTLRVIGDAEIRYTEDPVRMLRAVRFAATRGFRLCPQTEEPIGRLAYHLAEVPSARLYDEVLKMFHSGRAVPTLALLQRYGLFAHLFVQTAAVVASDAVARAMVERAMENTDARIGVGKPVIAPFLFAVLMWGPLRQRVAGRSKIRVEELRREADRVFDIQCERVAIPRRVQVPVVEIWEMQRRLEQPRPRSVDTLLKNKRFRAAYDFLLLREQSGEPGTEMAHWWTRYQETSPEQRPAMLGQLADPGKRTRKRRRRRPNNAARRPAVAEGS